MKIKNNLFGELEFQEDKILSFPEGIIGFEELKKFLLVNSGNPLFLWLVSVDEPELVFPLFGIKALFDDYPQFENYEPFGIVKLDPDPLKMTINVKAPILINQDKNEGYQKILDDDRYPIDYKLFIEK